MKGKYIYFLSILCLIFSIYTLSSVMIDEQIVEVKEGRQVVEFNAKDDHELIILDGQWRYYDETFVITEGISQEAKNDTYTLVTLPGKYERALDQAVTSKGYGTISLELDLPEESAFYGLSIEYIATSYRVFVDGVLMEEIGTVSSNPDQAGAIYAPSYVYFQGNNRVNIDIEFSNYKDKITFLQPIKIGLRETIEIHNRILLIAELMAIFTIFTIGLIILSFYIHRRSDTVPLHFSIFAFLMGIRSLTVNQRILQQIIPSLPWWLFLRLAFVPLILGVYFYVHFLKSRIPYALSDRWVKVTSTLSLCFTGLALLVVNVNTEIYFIVVAVVCYMATLIVAIFNVIKHIRNGGTEGLLLFALIMNFVVLLNDTVADVLPYSLSYLSSMAFSLFFIIEGIELSQYFAEILNKAEIVCFENQNLAQELTAVNESLETLVKERTEALEASNAKLIELNKQLEMLSYVDELTKIPNRRLFFDEIGRRFSDAKVSSNSISLFIMDIDFFKSYNDLYGHAKGDWCLFNVAQTIDQLAEDNGFLAARYGGEEFIVAGFGKPKKLAVEFGHALRESIEKLEIEHGKSSVADYVTLSVGGVHTQLEKSGTLMEIVDQADHLLYKAKTSGRNQFFI
jgi:diguanylate cyclase (GGDEF)-like protein